MHHQQSLGGVAAATAVAGPSRYTLMCTAFLSLCLVFALTKGPTQIPPPSEPHQSLFPRRHRILFHDGEGEVTNSGEPLSPPRPPSLTYFISGSANESGRIIRLLYSIYHPINQYLLHLDGSAGQTDCDGLAFTVQTVPLFRAAGKVHVIGKVDNVRPSGPSALSATLHGASVLLRVSSNWDWFINLSAADYPLVTQDDLLHIFSYLPRDLNFVNHTGYIGWRESKKLKPIVVDSALFLTENAEMYFATQKRLLPDAYRSFTGSSMTVLSRHLIEFCILGMDNLRTLLMYLSNTPASTSVYFPTIQCNSHQFNRSTINHSLHYASLDSRQHPILLNSSNFVELIERGAAFASPFPINDPILNRIDQEVLRWSPGKPVPGGWCLGNTTAENICSLWGDADVLKPGLGAKRLERRLIEVLSSGPTQCLDE